MLQYLVQTVYDNRLSTASVEALSIKLVLSSHPLLPPDWLFPSRGTVCAFTIWPSDTGKAWFPTLRLWPLPLLLSLRFCPGSRTIAVGNIPSFSSIFRHSPTCFTTVGTTDHIYTLPVQFLFSVGAVSWWSICTDLLIAGKAPFKRHPGRERYSTSSADRIS